GGDGTPCSNGNWPNAQLPRSGGPPPPDTPPPTVTTTSPATGATGVAVAANITATFSEAMTASSISTSSVTLVVQGTTPLLAASVNYDPVSLTVTLHPSASLGAPPTDLATVKGGASGVKAAAGNALALDKTWTFPTAAAADTTPPTVTTTSPATGATGVAVAANITATFSEAMTASSISTSSVTLVVQGTTPLLAASVNYDPVSLTVTLHPSASLAAATTYLATVKGGASGVKDAAGNALALDKTWTFTTAAAADTTSYLPDLAWTQVANGWGPVEKDRSNGENLAGDGAPLTLNGVTYAKGLGTHAAAEVDYALAGACSLFTASVGVDDEISSVEASLVFQVWGDTTKLYDSGTMVAATATKATSVDVPGRTTLRLVVTDGGDGNFYDHGD